MLELRLPKQEDWDEVNEVFVESPEICIQMEHSLISLSKWESKHCKPFLHNMENNISTEEFVDYLKCMTLTKNVPDSVYTRIINDVSILSVVRDYMASKHTATTFSKQQEDSVKGTGSSRDVITSEIIYYWMTQLQIPFTCERWNINRLLTLIKVCNIKQTPPKKMSNKDMLAQNRSLNAARRAKHKTKG